MNENKLPVSVIIVNYKTPDLTLKALRALYASSQLPAQIILVDNASEDNTPELVRVEFPQVEVIENKKNLGFAGGNNLGIKQSTQPYIWFLNSDTETGKQSMEQMYTYLEHNKNIGAVGPQLVYPNGELQSTGGFFPTVCNVFYYLFPFTFFLSKTLRAQMHSIALFPQEVGEAGLPLDYVTGAAIMVRKSVIDQIGGMPEEYFMYFEETDWCFQMRKAGFELKVINTEPVMHVYGGSFKTKYDTRRLTMFLNSLKKFVKKNYTGYKKIMILAEVTLFGRISIVLKLLKSKI